MMPPICHICAKDLDENEGGLIYFALRPSDIEWQQRMKEKHMVGHPPYAAWFCGKHYPRAKELSHLPINEAMKQMNQTQVSGD